MMHTSLPTGLLLVLFTALLVCDVQAQTKDEERIAALIAKLGHHEFCVRERATEGLQKIGLLAKNALEGALTSGSPEVRYRAQWLLGVIKEDVFQDRLQAFASGSPSIVLPGWDSYREVVGDSPDSRALFAEMQADQRGLLEVYDQAPATAQHFVRIIQSQGEEVSIASIATMLLVTGDERFKNSHETIRRLAELLYNVDFTEALSEKRGKLLRALLARCISRPCDVSNQALSNAKLVLAIETGCREQALALAVEQLTQLHSEGVAGAAWGDAHCYFIHTIGRFGNRTHIALLEPHFEDATEWGGATQVRDVALTAAIHLSGQPSRDYGFACNFPDVSWNGIGWDRFQLRDPDVREAVFTKWRAWSQENLQAEVQAN